MASQWRVEQMYRLTELERESSLRVAQGVAYASIAYPSWDAPYVSLLADSGYDLTSWVRGGQVVELERLEMVPALVKETARMGFIRLARTRITYVRYGVEWESRVPFAGFPDTQVTVHCPAEPRPANLAFSFATRGLNCTAQVRFTGDSLDLVDVGLVSNARGEREGDRFLELCRRKLTFPTSRKTFSAVMRPFTYQELGISDQNIRSFLDGNRYSVGLIQFATQPVLVLSCVD